MTLSPTMRVFLVVIAIAAVLVAVKRIAIDSYVEKELYRKDFVQEYVMARAIVDGGTIYPPMPELVERYFDPAPKIPWKHPAPHPPIAAVLSVPIGFFSYHFAVTLWILFELLCLAVILELLIRWWKDPVSLGERAVLYGVSLSTGPIIHELWYGQFSMVLTLGLVIGWLHLRRGSDLIGGASLGFTTALKLAGWPIVLYLFLRGRWRAVLSAGAVAGGLTAFAAAIVGPEPVVEYYTRVGPTITKQYNKHDENFSLWTVGGRLFSPDVADVASNFIAEPLLESQSLARWTTRLLPITALVIALGLSLRCRQFDSAYGIMICAGLPLNPVVWDHYLIMTIIPIAIIVRRLKDLGFPRGPSTLAGVALAITLFPNPAYLELIVKAFAVGDAYNVKVLPFLPGLITYLPLIALGIWIGLLVSTDGERNPT